VNASAVMYSIGSSRIFVVAAGASVRAQLRRSVDYERA
jgi:hypothetical protein